MSNAKEIRYLIETIEKIDSMTKMNETQTRSWAILPVTRVLFGKNKIFPEVIFTDAGPWQNEKATLVVAQLRSGYDKWKPVFITSFGTASYLKDTVGKIQAIHHDQTGSRSEVKVENILLMDGENILDEGNGIGVGEARPVWVFK